MIKSFDMFCSVLTLLPCSDRNGKLSPEEVMQALNQAGEAVLAAALQAAVSICMGFMRGDV
jgi:hypothetical protein